MNPYTNDQKVFWESKGKDSLDDGLMNLNKEATKTLSKDLGLALDKSQYGKREKVRLKVETKPNNSGIYSISVRKLSKELTYGDRISPVDYTKNYKLVDLDEASNDYLPDLRGEMVAGRLSSINGLQTMNKKVVFPYQETNIRLRWSLQIQKVSLGFRCIRKTWIQNQFFRYGVLIRTNTRLRLPRFPN